MMYILQQAWYPCLKCTFCTSHASAVACGVAVRGGRGTKTDDETRVPVVVDDEQPKGGLGVLGKFRPRCRCLGREKTEIRKQ